MGDLRDPPRVDPARAQWVRIQAQVPAKEWVARYGQLLLPCGGERFAYGDPELGAWVSEVRRICRDEGQLQQLREHLASTRAGPAPASAYNRRTR
jgi:hypothetical protein